MLYKHEEGFFKWGTHRFSMEVPLKYSENSYKPDPHNYHFLDIYCIAASNKNARINILIVFKDGTIAEFDETVDGFDFFVNHMEHGQYMLRGLDGLSDKLSDIRKSSLTFWNTLYVKPRTLKSKILSFFWIRKYIFIDIFMGRVRNAEPLDS